MHPVRRTIEAVGLVWACILGGTLTIALTAGLWIWIATATSGARGHAAVIRQHNSGSNQVQQNATLLGDNATVLSDAAKIKTLAANQATAQDRMDLSGQELNCQSDVTKYNADAASILAAGLLPDGLPSSYPTSLCEVQTP